MANSQHMVFQRYGRSLHLRIRSVEDLASVVELDSAHWVASGAPLETLSCDRTFLEWVDSDHNGRILCFEVRQAVQWALKLLRDTGGLVAGSESLRLDAIDTDDPQGARIAQSAAKMLDRLGGSSDTGQITLQQVRRIKADEEGASVSEAGVVLPAAADDPDMRQFLSDVVATVGGADHPAGGKGVDQAHLDEFCDAARAHLDWREQGDADPAIHPLGERTADAFAIYAALGTKIDQYFAQCQAVAFAPRAAERLAPSVEELQTLDLSDPEAIEEFIRRSPLALPRADRTLDLEEGINQSHAADLARLREAVLAPVLGGPVTTLAETQWRQVKQFFDAYQAWSAAVAGPAVAPLGAGTLAKYLSPQYRRAAEALIAASTATALVLDNIRLTEKLLLHQANLLTLVNNFVSFPHLYDPSRRALFEMGSLVMDGRRFQMSIRAKDRAQHSTIAKTGNLFVLYVEVLPGGGEKFEVAVPVTSGGKGNLCVGKRGVFVDVQGREHDARVVQIIENPISVSEALWSPFRRIGKMLGGKIESITASAEKQFDTAAAGVIDHADAKTPAPAPAPPARPAGGGMLAGGLLMGGGVAIAALGSAFAYIAKTLQGVENKWYILWGVGGVVLAVALPIAVVSIIKLRRRDLSAILEGSGWAINARMRLTMRQSWFFTSRPALPQGARGRRIWVWILLAVVLAAAGAAAAAVFMLPRG